MSHLINFYGTECPHCERMEPVMEQFTKETGLAIDRLEIWHNKENSERMKEYDIGGECGGVPFFANIKTGKTICGEATVEELKEWAKE